MDVDVWKDARGKQDLGSIRGPTGPLMSFGLADGMAPSPVGIHNDYSVLARRAIGATDYAASIRRPVRRKHTLRLRCKLAHVRAVGIHGIDLRAPRAIRGE